MKLCIVNRNTGWPVHDPKHAHNSVVEVDDAEAADGFKSGYLIPADPRSDQFTPAHAVLLKAHLDAKAQEPAPTVAFSTEKPSDPKEEAARAKAAAESAEAARLKEVTEILNPQPPNTQKPKEPKPANAEEPKE